MSAEPTVALLDGVWTSIRELCATLGDRDWQAPTECPGWSVLDNISHLIATERMLAGKPPAPRLDSYPDHVKNAIGRMNEDAIVARRALPPAEVLDEFNSITSERVSALRSMTSADFDKVGPSPVGDVPYREFMRVRVFDCWSHEQDIRRAVGRPGHRRGPVVELVLAWHRRNLGYVVGKKAQAPEGSSVRFAVAPAAESAGDDVTIVVNGGRAAIAEPGAIGEATVTLRTDLDTYQALLCGRIGGGAAIAAKSLTIEGDATLGARVAESMGYVF